MQHIYWSPICIWFHLRINTKDGVFSYSIQINKSDQKEDLNHSTKEQAGPHKELLIVDTKDAIPTSKKKQTKEAKR